MRRNESCAFWPSSVLVCSHSSPRAIRSAPGVATTPYRPGIRLAMTAWPASGDKVVPFDSYLGQTAIVPVMPVWVLSGTSGLFGLFGSEGTCPTREIFVTGQASRPVAGVQLTATPLTVAVQVVLVVVPDVVVEQDTSGAIGVPPMPWPQAPGVLAAAEPFVQSALRLPLANGLPASPGKIVR